MHSYVFVGDMAISTTIPCILNQSQNWKSGLHIHKSTALSPSPLATTWTTVCHVSELKPQPVCTSSAQGQGPVTSYSTKLFTLGIREHRQRGSEPTGTAHVLSQEPEKWLPPPLLTTQKVKAEHIYMLGN
jgi:hypothetical protein